ncbi:MAG: PAS domain S-box protein [candidate division NC10 bacterium]|nr:PAS domain S-box protein [candidate division NC10 bacterium]
MFKRFYTSLRFKMTVGVILILIAVMSVVYFLQYNWFRREMIERLGLSSTPLSDVIKGSLKHAMETRNLEEITYIIENVSKQKGVIKVFVADKKGEIKISPDRTEIGRRLAPQDPTCQICHRLGPENRNKTVIFKTETGVRIFRNVNPIANEPECYSCHDRKDKLNGVLISDFSMAEVDKELSSKFKEMLLSLLFTVAVTVLTISFTMNRLVISKLERFVKATKALGKGDLDLRVKVEGEDEIGELAASFNEMVESLRRARELRERKELLENVLNNVKESIIVFDPEEAIIAFSRGSEQTFGYRAEEVVGKKYTTLGEERHGILGVIKNRGTFSGELRLRSKDGRYFPAQVHVMPLWNERDELLAFVEIARDLTEEKVKERLQQQLIHSEKLAATGQLAAGVAHELNNPLGNVLLYSKLLMEELEPHDIKYKNTKNIVDNTLRCKEIVRNLLDYAKESEVHMAINDINEIAETSVRMLGNEMRINNIEYELRLDRDLPKITCDRNQLQQVFVNLIQNAIQAIENHGRIEIFTTKSPEGDGVIVGVKDNGKGIPAEALSKVFEPFYTTKEKGTGLGLSICYGIVERHKGKIWVESLCQGEDGRGAALTGEPREEKGTTFYVKLPLV